MNLDIFETGHGDICDLDNDLPLFIVYLSRPDIYVPGVPTSFRQEFSKKSLNVMKSKKNSSKFV